MKPLRFLESGTLVMVADRAVHATTDNNGGGDPRTVIVDVSALGTFSSATSLTIDAKTSATSGPVPVNVAPAEDIGDARRVWGDSSKVEALT
jgi:hypothetical protein